LRERIVYDGDGNRVSETVGSTTTKYLVDTLNPTGYSQVLDELVSGSVTRTYAYGLQRISENQLSGSTWTPTFYGYDGHGRLAHLRTTPNRAAPPFVIFERWAPRTMVSGDFPDAELSFTRFVHEDRAMSALRVVAETAPWPLLRFEHQSTLHRVAMHVA